MGLPDTFRIPVSDTQAYRQFGNSVVMPVMREVARTMMAAATPAAGASVDERRIVPKAAPKAAPKAGRKPARAATSLATAGGR